MVTQFLYKDYFIYPETGVDIHWWSTKVDYFYPNLHHTHDYYEIFIVTEGELLHKINDREEIIEKNCMCLIRPDDAHSFYPSHGVASSHLNIAVTREIFNLLCSSLEIGLAEKIERADRNLSVKLSKIELDYLIDLSNQILLNKPTAHNYVLPVKTMILSMLTIYCNRVLEENSYPQWFASLLDKINSPVFMEKRVTDIYEIAPYSPPVLIRYFKKYLGCTCVHYLEKLKINYACNLLRNTNYTILYICGLVGYDSLSHFHSVFKKIMNTSPAEYRKQKNVFPDTV